MLFHLLIKIFLWVVGCLALVIYAAFLAGRWFFIERDPDEIHLARTEDGWRIAVSRYRPDTPNGADPVLLCHGIGANRLNLDL